MKSPEVKEAVFLASLYERRQMRQEMYEDFVSRTGSKLTYEQWCYPQMSKLQAEVTRRLKLRKQHESRS